MTETDFNKNNKQEQIVCDHPFKIGFIVYKEI